MRSNPIGCLDSGYGGLTVVKELMRQLPREDLVYVGDNARCPYGSRDPEEVKAFTFEIMDFLMEKNVKMIVIACNTATAVCLPEARERYPIPVIGVITPGSRAAIFASKTGRIGVIGTEVTIASHAYTRELHRINPRLHVVAKACPPFVPIVEEDRIQSDETKQIVREYLEPIQQMDIDTLILGCTHYPLLSQVIQNTVGPHVQLISSAEETAREASVVLSERDLLNEGNLHATYEFYTTGSVERFHAVGERWLGFPIHVEKIAFSYV
ncbi:glutamate racemase [Collibacillus ludicampi]|uniref:Glutamate racemase n=1 Tax=Collibacillus ludicampi TaxID=2771369 RepID=A0AAV4LAB7_9BACL|nr:glutamate racemase [Collibacillus ludicampi]GIM44651.1 glutamate racemase [Collibacillus ludicampi]